MTIYVDALREVDGPRGRGFWCHLTTDGELFELHRFARRLGLKRDWFQDHPRHPHYDLTAGMRWRAIALGAKAVTRAVMA